MKTLLFTITLLIGTLSILFAQSIPNNQLITHKQMNTTPTAEEQNEILEHIHAVFPESTAVPPAQIQALISKAWKKGLQYEFDKLEDLGIYIMATYALGENFEDNIRGAARLLEDFSIPSRQKADRLESLARQELAKGEKIRTNNGKC